MLNISTPEPDVQQVVQTEPPADADVENQQPHEPPVILFNSKFIFRKSLKLALSNIYEHVNVNVNYCLSNHLNECGKREDW